MADDIDVVGIFMDFYNELNSHIAKSDALVDIHKKVEALGWDFDTFMFLAVVHGIRQTQGRKLFNSMWRIYNDIPMPELDQYLVKKTEKANT